MTKTYDSPRVIVVVQDGVIQSVHSDTDNITVAVLDYDNKDVETDAGALAHFQGLEKEVEGMQEVKVL